MLPFIAQSAAPRQVDLHKAWASLRPLFTEQHLWTAFWGCLVLLFTIAVYKKLKSISPVLVPLTLLLVAFITLTMWTQTRTEPAFLSPIVSLVAQFIPNPNVVPAH